MSKLCPKVSKSGSVSIMLPPLNDLTLKSTWLFYVGPSRGGERTEETRTRLVIGGKSPSQLSCLSRKPCVKSLLIRSTADKVAEASKAKQPPEPNKSVCLNTKPKKAKWRHEKIFCLAARDMPCSLLGDWRWEFSLHKWFHCFNGWLWNDQKKHIFLSHFDQGLR